jgi:hypothetical protein
MRKSAKSLVSSSLKCTKNEKSFYCPLSTIKSLERLQTICERSYIDGTLSKDAALLVWKTRQNIEKTCGLIKTQHRENARLERARYSNIMLMEHYLQSFEKSSDTIGRPTPPERPVALMLRAKRLGTP